MSGDTYLHTNDNAMLQGQYMYDWSNKNLFTNHGAMLEGQCI